MVKPFLPDIIKGVFERVDAAFSTRAVDPFNVFFDKGLANQVRRSVYKADGNFPLGWLVYKYGETFGGGGLSVNSEVSFEIVLAMPTSNLYSQQEREDLNYKPRLLPIYEQLMFEMKREGWFTHPPGENSIKHTRLIAPYWGMGDVNGVDNDNLFKNKKVDCIFLSFTNLKVRRRPCATDGGYPVPDTSIYPISQKELTFYDDLELIVGNGEQYDPAHASDTISIPFLNGKDFEVQQRVYGQMRQRKSKEIEPIEGGGFKLLGGLKFNTGDTYFVKIRPQYL